MIVDIHMHIGAPYREDGKAYWSSKFENTAAFFAMKAMIGHLFQPITEEKIVSHLENIINSSTEVEKVVLLALDEVYDENGNLRKDLTNLFVSNDLIKEFSSSNDRILKGYSIHPYRKDAIELLEKAKEEGASLIKLIPSSQMFNPASEILVKYWKKIAELRLPVLIHTGPEYAIPTSDKKFNEYNDPKYLVSALDEGVIIIAAHCATPYFWVFDAPYEKHFSNLIELFNEREKRGWNLYADVSALATPTRIPYIKKILNNFPAERLFFGSDYPIPISTLGYEIKDKPSNPLDLYVKLLKTAGFPENVFHNWSTLFMKDTTV